MPAVRVLTTTLRVRGSTRSEPGSCVEEAGRSCGGKARGTRGDGVLPCWEPGPLSALALSQSRRNSEKLLPWSEKVSLSLSCNSLVALPRLGQDLARSGVGGTSSLGLSTLPA